MDDHYIKFFALCHKSLASIGFQMDEEMADLYRNTLNH